MTNKAQLNQMNGRFIIEVTSLQDEAAKPTAKVTDTTNGKTYMCRTSVHVRKDFYEQYIDTTNVEGCTNKGRYTVKRKLRPVYNEATGRYQLSKDDIPVVERSDLTSKSTMMNFIDLV